MRSNLNYGQMLPPSLPDRLDFGQLLNERFFDLVTAQTASFAFRKLKVHYRFHNFRSFHRFEFEQLFGQLGGLFETASTAKNVNCLLYTSDAADE